MARVPVRWVLVVLMATGVFIIGCGSKGDKKPPGPGAAESKTLDTPVTVVIAERGSIDEELELTGTCEAFQEVDVIPEISGKVVGVYADVGDTVAKGDVLFRLDTSLVQKQRIQAERTLDAAQAQLTQASETAKLTDKQTEISIRQAEQGVAAAEEQLRKAEESYKLTQDQVASQIQQAKVGLASAQEQQREVQAGARSQEVAQAEARVRQAEADLSLKKADYDRYSRLHQQGAVAAATLDQYSTAYQVAQQTLDQARQQLSLTREGARQEQRRLAELAVQQAQEKLSLAQAGQRQVDIASRDVESARVGLRQAQEQLRLAKASRKQYDVSVANVRAARAGIGQAAAGRDLLTTTESKYAVHAPISGRVASRSIDVGEGASFGMSAMRIVADNPIRVDCTVSELDVAKVKVGDGGDVKVDGLPGKQFFGRVTAVSPQAKQDQRNYTARVEIDNPDGLILAGMFARVTLVLSERHDVVVVSRDCLVERGTSRRAYLVQDGVIKVHDVETGIINRGEVEIVKGIEAGDRVVAGGQGILAEGQKVKPVLRTTTQEDEPAAGGDDGAMPEGGAAKNPKADKAAPKREAAGPQPAPGSDAKKAAAQSGAARKPREGANQPAQSGRSPRQGSGPGGGEGRSPANR